MNNPDISQEELIARRKINTIGFFDRVASQYDRTGPRFFSYFGQRMVLSAQISAGENVLDVAAGRGAVFFPAAQAVGATGNLIGVDLSGQMVRELGQEAQRLGIENVQVLEMDAEKLQFPDASFDVVLCGFALFFFPQLERSLAEMMRVLKPGGRIAVSTWDESMDQHWEWFYRAVQAHLSVNPTEKPVPARPPSNNLDSLIGLKKILQAAGFGDVQVVFEPHDFVYSSFDEWWAALGMHWTRMALDRIEQSTGSEGLERFKKDIYEKLGAIRQADGVHQIFPALIAVGTKTT